MQLRSKRTTRRWQTVWSLKRNEQPWFSKDGSYTLVQVVRYVDCVKMLDPGWGWIIVSLIWIQNILCLIGLLTGNYETLDLLLQFPLGSNYGLTERMRAVSGMPLTVTLFLLAAVCGRTHVAQLAWLSGSTTICLTTPTVATTSFIFVKRCSTERDRERERERVYHIHRAKVVGHLPILSYHHLHDYYSVRCVFRTYVDKAKIVQISLDTYIYFISPYAEVQS